MAIYGQAISICKTVAFLKRCILQVLYQVIEYPHPRKMALSQIFIRDPVRNIYRDEKNRKTRKFSFLNSYTIE